MGFIVIGLFIADLFNTLFYVLYSLYYSYQPTIKSDANGYDVINRKHALYYTDIRPSHSIPYDPNFIYVKVNKH